ncbi:MAG: type II secretion system F family protein [Fimbriimonadales bacterium]
MPLYRYHAVDGSGRAQTGTIQATDVRTAQSQLQARGWIVQQIVSLPETAPTPPTMPAPTTTLPDTDRLSWDYATLPPAVLWRLLVQLQALVQAGYPLSEAFRSVATRVRHGRLTQACAEVGARAAGGEPISQAMARYPDLFPKFLIGNLQAGEQGGYLAEALKHLTDYYEGRQKIRMYSVFPKGVLWLGVLTIPTAVTGLIGIMRAAPRLADNPSGDLGQNLSIVAAEIGRTLLLVGIPIILLLVGMGVVLRWAMKRWGLGASLRLRTPFVTGLSGWERSSALGLFLFHLDRLTRAGFAPATVWEFAVNTVPNAELARTLKSVRPTSEGERLDALLARTRLVPPDEVAIITTGLQTGTVNEVLQRLHALYLDQAQFEAKRIPSGMLRTGCLLLVILNGVAFVALYWLWYRVFVPSVERLFSP